MPPTNATESHKTAASGNLKKTATTVGRAVSAKSAPKKAAGTDSVPRRAAGKAATVKPSATPCPASPSGSKPKLQAKRKAAAKSPSGEDVALMGGVAASLEGFKEDSSVQAGRLQAITENAAARPAVAANAPARPAAAGSLPAPPRPAAAESVAASVSSSLEPMKERSGFGPAEQHAEDEKAAICIQRHIRGTMARISFAILKESQDEVPDMVSRRTGISDGPGNTVKDFCKILHGETRDLQSTILPNVSDISDIDVKLHLYDVGLSTAVKHKGKVFYGVGTGIFHLGVEANGQEYSYGYIEKGSGVFSCEPACCEHHGLRQTIPMRACTMSGEGIAVVVSDLSNFWHGASYDLMKRNCVNFAHTLCRSLGVGEIPAWLLRLAAAGAYMYDTTLAQVMAEAKLAGTANKKFQVVNSPQLVLDLAQKDGGLPEEYAVIGKVTSVQAKDILRRGKIIEPKWISGDLMEKTSQRSSGNIGILLLSKLKMKAKMHTVCARTSAACATDSERSSLKAADVGQAISPAAT